MVKKVLSSGKAAGQVARDVDLTETAVRHCVKRAEVARGKGPPDAVTTAVESRRRPVAAGKHLQPAKGIACSRAPSLQRVRAPVVTPSAAECPTR